MCAGIDYSAWAGRPAQSQLIDSFALQEIAKATGKRIKKSKGIKINKLHYIKIKKYKKYIKSNLNAINR